MLLDASEKFLKPFRQVRYLGEPEASGMYLFLLTSEPPQGAV